MHSKEYDGSKIKSGCEECGLCGNGAVRILSPTDRELFLDHFSGTVTERTGGNKRDSGKTRLDLIPTKAIEQLGKAFTHGAHKYSDYNYRGGMDYSRLYGATLRHLNAFWGGEDIDKDSGLPHLALAGSEICMLIATNEKHDDRYKESE